MSVDIAEVERTQYQFLSAPVMSTDVSQVGVALFPSFNIF